jgi:hypothetical protein
MRLLKWFFTFLAFLWLYQAVVRPLLLSIFRPLIPRPPHRPAPPPRSEGETTLEKRKTGEKESGEYIDYEEIK